jgi:hypothetical protein
LKYNVQTLINLPELETKVALHMDFGFSDADDLSFAGDTTAQKSRGRKGQRTS